MLRRWLRPAALRLRAFMQADVLAELSLLRAQAVLREDLEKLAAAVDSALLALALHADDQRQVD